MSFVFLYLFFYYLFQDGIGIGDRVRLCSVIYTIKDLIGEHLKGAIVKLNRPYDGTTGLCRMWRMPLSKKQNILHGLSVRKLKCLSLYCLAKIEEEERQIEFDLDDEMTRLPNEKWTTLQGKDTMDELQKMVDQEKKESTTTTTTILSPSPSSLNVAAVEKGNDRSSERKSDVLQTYDGSEEDAMNGQDVILQGTSYPAEKGNTRNMKTIVQSVSLPEKKSVNEN